MRIALVPVLLTSLACTAFAGHPGQAPNNPYGVHLLQSHLTPFSQAKLNWARALVGRGGYLKTMIADIDEHTTGLLPAQIQMVERIYDLEMIPIIRLAGHYDGEAGYWHKPTQDPDGGYTAVAQGFSNAVADLPRRGDTPIYVQIWNEPNLSVEWSGTPDLEEYGRFFVEVSNAVRALDDPRIRILNGAFASSPQAAREMFTKVPESVWAFDVWASHPYPHSHPPEINHHEGTARPGDTMVIDSYLLELDVVESFRGERTPVMLVETGYDLGNATQYERGFPIVDDDLRADYIARAFRDYWSQWPEVLAVTPFLFCDPYWERFNWVALNSETGEDGLPTKRYRQYDTVLALAKPTDPHAAASGRVVEDTSGRPIAHARVQGGGHTTHTDSQGGYYLPKLEPGPLEIRVTAKGFDRQSRSLDPLKAGENSVWDARLTASQTGSLRGTARDGATGEPLPNVLVVCGPPNREVVTDAKGRYAFDDLPPVALRMQATKDGYTSHDMDEVAIRPGRTTRIDPRLGPDPRHGETNLLRNPSFEGGLGKTTLDGIALSWERRLGRDGLAAAVSDEQARSGMASQRLQAGEAVAVRQITHYNTAQPGMRYRARVWVKATDMQNQEAFLRLCATNNAGNQLACEESEAVGEDTDWRLLEVEALCPQGAERISVELHLRPGPGVTWWDDAGLFVPEP